jgi:DNA-binding GntR family transcriptional regulator
MATSKKRGGRRGAAGNLKRSAYEHIRQGLLWGKLPPGTLLSPAALAREIGISHTPVREAISQLESEGLVEQLPRVGARVRVIDRQELIDLFELRELLESGAAAQAAERITAEQVARLRHYCEQYGTLVEQCHTSADDGADGEALGQRMVILDVAFHLELLGAAHNRWLRKIVGDLHLMTYVFRHRRSARTAGPETRRRAEEVQREHERIVQALERRDGQAAAAEVVRHLRGARQHQLDILDAAQRQHADADAAWPEHVLRLIGQMETGPKTTPEQRPTPKKSKARS